MGLKKKNLNPAKSNQKLFFAKSEPVIPRTVNFGIQMSCSIFPWADHSSVLSFVIFRCIPGVAVFKFRN